MSSLNSCFMVPSGSENYLWLDVLEPSIPEAELLEFQFLKLPIQIQFFGTENIVFVWTKQKGYDLNSLSCQTST